MNVPMADPTLRERLREMVNGWRREARADAIHAVGLAKHRKALKQSPCQHCLSAATAMATAQCIEDLEAVLKAVDAVQASTPSVETR